MPSVTVHLQLAQRVLDRFAAAPRLAPFDPGDAGAVSAFRQGAFGPDLGYMPGGFRPLSDLAHCLRSGTLTRALIERARTPIERAFTWGWVTHVLADTLIHPMVGCAVGELVHGTPTRFESGDARPVEHVRVEAGLDAIYAARHPELRSVSLRPAFDAASIDLVVGAFRDTYGAAPRSDVILRSHVGAARRAAQALGLASVTARILPTGAQPLRTGDDRHFGPLSRFRSVVGRRNVVLGYLFPAAPSLWFLDAVRDVEEIFVDVFDEEYETRGAGLDDVNLDTGRPELEEHQSRSFGRAVALLRELGGHLPLRRANGALPARGAA